MLRRSGFTRKAPEMRASSSSTTVKAKEHQCEAPGCEATFVKRRMEHVVCSPRCLIAKRKADEKAVKAVQKQKQARDKGVPYWLKKAQEAVNWYCRARDLAAGKGCISCGAQPAQKRGGTMDAGHYRSVGSASHLRFFTPQIRLQCVRCNRDLASNPIEYRKALVAERGPEWVDRIESMWWVAKWDVDYLMRLTRVANEAARRMERRIG